MNARMQLLAPLLTLTLSVPTLAQGPRVTSFGTGCAGSAGTPVLAPLAGELPQIGWEYSVEISNGPLNGFAAGIVGTFETPLPGGLALPVDLGIIGMPGCTLYTGIQRQQGLVISGGSAQWTIDLPWDVSFLGFTFFQQAVVIDPGANALGLISTNALENVIDDFPELTITSGSPTVNTRTLAPGQWIDISSFTMKNESFHVESGDFETGWYLSSNSLIGFTDTLLDSRFEASMGPRENRIVPGRSLRIPFGIPPGTYWLGPYVDHLDQVDEWKEFPNFKTIAITVTEPPTPLPDLTFPNGNPAATPTSVSPGESIDIAAFPIANQGFYPATSFATGIYLSPWLVDIKGGTLLKSFNIGGLVQGLPFNVSAQSVTIPADTVPGNYWLGFVLDRNSSVAELDETNNIVARLITVKPTKAELVITSGELGMLTAIPRPLPFLPVPLPVGSFTVKNEGGLPSGPFNVGYYHDSNGSTRITADDRKLDQVSHPGLAPGESYTFPSKVVVIPPIVPMGWGHFGILVDNTNAVDEQNEDNNWKNRRTFISLL